MYTHTMYTHNIHTNNVHVQRTHTVYTHSVHTQCTHTMYTHNAHTQCTRTFGGCSFIVAISWCFDITIFWDNFYVWDITLHDNRGLQEKIKY